jgi:hypothetical protein
LENEKCFFADFAQTLQRKAIKNNCPVIIIKDTNIIKKYYYFAKKL